MTWKTISPATAGDSTQFAGNDLNKVSNLFNGVLNVDTVDFNSNVLYRDLKFRIRNPANTFSYIVHPGEITSDRTATLPKLTSNDTFVFANATQTLKNKTMDGRLNTFRHIDDDAIDTHHSSKISITNKDQIHPSIIYADQSNTWSGLPQRFLHQSQRWANPSLTFDFVVNTTNIPEDRNVTLPLLLADDTFVFQNNVSSLQNKTLLLASNILTDLNAVAGDLCRHDGTTFRRFAKGLAGQVLRTNLTSGDIEWISLASVLEELTNKTIDANSNAIDHIRLYPSAGRKYGEWIGIDTNAGTGLLNTLTNAAGQTTLDVWDTTVGKGINFATSTTSNTRSGMRGTTAFTMGAWNPRLKCKIRLGQAAAGNSIRLYVGFTSNTSSEPTGNDVLNTANGFMIGFRSTDTNFQCLHNDGSASTTQFDNTSIIADTTLHTIDVRSDYANSRWAYSIDGSALIYITAKLPAATAHLTAVCMLETASTSTRNFDLFFLEADQLR